VIPKRPLGGGLTNDNPTAINPQKIYRSGVRQTMSRRLGGRAGLKV
jgi:hypothetical protein